MKNKLMLLEDKMWLKGRGVIESVIDLLKHICDIEHSRHRSPVNAIVKILGGLSAYSNPFSTALKYLIPVFFCLLYFVP
jgi:hypothetical protein